MLLFIMCAVNIIIMYLYVQLYTIILSFCCSKGGNSTPTKAKVEPRGGSRVEKGQGHQKIKIVHT